MSNERTFKRGQATVVTRVTTTTEAEVAGGRYSLSRRCYNERRLTCSAEKCARECSRTPSLNQVALRRIESPAAEAAAAAAGAEAENNEQTMKHRSMASDDALMQFEDKGRGISLSIRFPFQRRKDSAVGSLSESGSPRVFACIRGDRTASIQRMQTCLPHTHSPSSCDLLLASFLLLLLPQPLLLQLMIHFYGGRHSVRNLEAAALCCCQK